MAISFNLFIYLLFIYLVIYLFIYFFYLFVYLFIYLFISIYLLFLIIYLFVCLFVYLFIRWFVHSLTLWLALIYLFVYLFIYSFVRSFFHSIFYSSNYLLNLFKQGGPVTINIPSATQLKRVKQENMWHISQIYCGHICLYKILNISKQGKVFSYIYMYIRAEAYSRPLDRCIEITALKYIFLTVGGRGTYGY